MKKVSKIALNRTFTILMCNFIVLVLRYLLKVKIKTYQRFKIAINS
jgi:hypothetical protein